MPRTEDGEFELVLGNKQLLSVFFIMVVLLGVFFAMGYIAGRNSSPAVADAKKDAKPIVVDSGQRASAMPEAQPQGGQPVSTPPDNGAPVSTQPATAPAPASVTPEPAPVAQTPAPATKPVEKEGAAGTPRVVEPQGGVPYLQVLATARPEAEAVGQTLIKRGFKAQLAAVPNTAGTFRILVGPLKDAADIARTRADLEKAGFKPIVRRF